MNRLARAIVSIAIVAASAIMPAAMPLHAQATNAVVVSACGTPPATYTAGANRQLTQDTNGNLCSSTSGGGGGATSTNLTQINGQAVNTGAGAAGTGTQRVITSSDSTIGIQGVYTQGTQPTYTTGQRAILNTDSRGNQRAFPVLTLITGTDGYLNTNLGLFGRDASDATNSMPAVANYGFNGTNWDRFRTIVGSDGTGLGITAVAMAPTSAATGGLSPVVSTTLESCHVLKSGAGNLYSLAVTIQATTVIVQVFNATTAPADGAVTPIWSQAVISNGTLGGNSWNFGIPLRGSTGLTACASSATTPFTKTASATAMFSGLVQ